MRARKTKGSEMMKKILWQPSKERIKQANMTMFVDFVNKKHRLNINSYSQVHNWSTENIPDF
jgi:acetoacetyl-CoA synthetase